MKTRIPIIKRERPLQVYKVELYPDMLMLPFERDDSPSYIELARVHISSIVEYIHCCVQNDTYGLGYVYVNDLLERINPRLRNPVDGYKYGWTKDSEPIVWTIDFDPRKICITLLMNVEEIQK